MALLTPRAWRMLRQMPRASGIAAALALGLGLALGGAACGDPRLEELAAIRAQVCACKTAACGEEAMKRMPQEGVRTDHRAQQIAKAMMDCLAKLYVADRPSTDPDAETPDPDPGAGAAGAAGSAAGPTTGSAAGSAAAPAAGSAGAAAEPAGATGSAPPSATP